MNAPDDIAADHRFDALCDLACLADGVARGEEEGGGMTDWLAASADVVAEVLCNVYGPPIDDVLAWAGFPERLPVTLSTEGA